MWSSNFSLKRLWRYAAVLPMLFAVSMEVNAAATPRTDVWQPNGTVFAVEMSKAVGADSAFIGGDFTYVGPDTGNSVQVGLATTSSHLPTGASWPKIDGNVYSVIPDGSGGWYVGGDFTIINDGADDRNRLARLSQVDGVWSVDTWDPDVNGAVRAMVLDGTTLYVGGDFNLVGADTRNLIAAIDTSTGVAKASWNPNVTGNSVMTMALSDTTLYVGGDFTGVDTGPVTRNNLAALSTIATASPYVISTWDPNVTGGTSVVHSMALDAVNGRLYVGGNFTDIDVEAVNNLAALSTTATASPYVISTWDPDVTGGTVPVRALRLSGDSLYVGGDFTTINAFSRTGLVVIDVTDISSTSLLWGGTVLPFAGATSVSQIMVSGTAIYVAWNGMLDGDSLGRMQVLRSSDGAVQWSVDAGGSINAIAPVSGNLFIGGAFDSGGGRIRRNLAEINISTGEDAGIATDWDVSVNGPVHSIEAKDDGIGLYVGGAFTAITTFNTTKTRDNIAFLSATTGVVEEWDPSITGAGAEVSAMALSPDQATLYVGGGFDNVATEARFNIAALNTTVEGIGGVNVLNTWNPTGADGKVRALVVSSDGGLVFAGGDFSIIAGESRRRLAAIKSNGSPLPDALWAMTDPNAVDGVVRTLALSSDDSKLYLGGDFSQITDGESGSPHPRNRIAALEVNSGSGKWSVVPTVDPNVTGTSVYSLGLSSDDQMLWLGGEFTDVAGSPRNQVARYNLTESLLTAWNPNVLFPPPPALPPPARVYATERTANDSLAIIGGDFTEVGGVPHKYLAIFDTARPTVTDHIAGGFYNTSPLDIALSCTHNTTAGPCSIFYRTDGSGPTQADTEYLYTQPPPPPPDPPPPPTTLSITADTVLKFFARDAHGSVSETFTVSYGIDQTFPQTKVQPDVVLPDVLGTIGVPEVADIEVSIALVCEDNGGANCDNTFYTTDDSAPHHTDGTPSDTAFLYRTPLTPKQLLPLESLTLADLKGAETDVFFDMTLADIITSEADAAIRVNLDAFTLDDIPRNAVALNSIDLLRVREFVDLAEIRLDSLTANLLGNVVNPANVPADAVTLADIDEDDLDLTQITLGSITGAAYSLAEIPASFTPPPVYILASQVPLIQVNLDRSENRIVLDAVRLETISLEQISAQFIPGSKLYGIVNLQFFSVDRAGNSEVLDTGVKSQKYYVDIGAPTTTAFPNTDGNVFTSEIHVVLTCSDFENVLSSGFGEPVGGSGCKDNGTFYTTDGSTPNPEDAGPTRPTKIYTGSIAISTATVLRYMSIDNMGNESAPGFEVYAFTFSSVGHSGVGGSGLAVWLLALLGLALRRCVARAAI